MVNHFLFKDRDGQTPLPTELQKGLRIKTIQTVGELDEYEEANIAKGLSWLVSQTKDPKKYNFWIELHTRLFRDVWNWAGKIRNHELQNPDFAKPFQIWPELYRLEKDIETWILYKSYPEREIAARFHEQVETIHPFANGNGRFGRILIEHICQHHQMPVPTWGQVMNENPNARRKAYIDGLNQARWEKNYSALSELIFS